MTTMNAQQEENGMRVVVKGDILSTSVDQLMAEWKGMIQQAGKLDIVVVDLENVKIIDSRGLNLLIGFYKECVKRGWRFQVVNYSKDLKRLFALLKLAERFGVQ